MVQLPRTFHPADMRKVEDGLRRCEARGARHLSELMMVDPDVGRLLDQGVQANLAAATGSLAYFVLPWIGGGSDGLNGLPHEVNAILGTETMQSKLRKLAASGLEESHLFLIILPTAFSYPVFETLAFGGQLPSDAPRLPSGLSQLWLLTGVRAGGVVRGISGQGWYRDEPYDGMDINRVRSSGT